MGRVKDLRFAGAQPMLLDISACTIAEGKIKVALNKGVPVPENCIIDAQGRPTTDPKVFYAAPPGAESRSPNRSAPGTWML